MNQPTDNPTMKTKNPTKKATTAFIKTRLATDPAWATRGLLKLYQQQTPDEQSEGVARYENGAGFSGTDAAFLGSLATQYLQRGSLSARQMGFLHRLLPRYAAQLMRLADSAKLNRAMTTV